MATSTPILRTSVSIGERKCVIGGVVGVAVILAYGPLLVEFAGWQWRRAHYQFFPFVLAAVVGLLAYRWWHAERRYDIQGGPMPTIALVALAWLLLLAGMSVHSPLAAAVSLVLLTAAGTREIARRWKVEYLWGIWALLLLVLPLPLGLDGRLITFLQLASSRLSSQVLDALGVLHLMEGNTLALADKRLFVDEACSGIVSILSIVAAAAIVGVWWNRPPLHVVLLAASGVAWATLLNVVRISLIAWVFAAYGIDWSAGTSHEVLSLVLFALAFGALVSTDQLLLAWITPVAQRWEEWSGHELVYGGWLAQAWDFIVEGPLSAWGQGASERSGENGPLPATAIHQNENRPTGQSMNWAAGIVGVAFVGLAAAQQLFWPVTTVEPLATRAVPQVDTAVAMDASTLPRNLAGVTLVEHRQEKRETKHLFGEYSQVYEFEDSESRPVVVSCDFAFPGGWHELTVCYKAVGWELDSRQIISDGDDDWPLVEAVFHRPDGQYAAVQFCEFGAGGEPLEPPSDSLAASLASAFSRRQQTDHGDVFQVQVLLTSPIAPSEARLAAGRSVLKAARERFRDEIIKRPQ